MTKILHAEIAKIVKIALAEDCAFLDITSDSTIAENSSVTFAIKARQPLTFCGKAVITEVFAQLKKSKKFQNAALQLKFLTKEGEALKPGKSIVEGQGNARLIFAAERVILNLIQHLSGVATLTQKFVTKLNNKKIKILDTRKTLPGLRALQKYAVTIGGGANHRFNLSDMVLIKDNHIAAAGGIKEALLAVKKKNRKIEIECDNFTQVAEAVELRPDIIMLDNMDVAAIKKCSLLIRKKSPKTKIEISGGVTLDKISLFSKLDVDFISVGGLTHSARAVDIGLDILG